MSRGSLEMQSGWQRTRPRKGAEEDRFGRLSRLREVQEVSEKNQKSSCHDHEAERSSRPVGGPEMTATVTSEAEAERLSAAETARWISILIHFAFASWTFL